MELVKYVIGVPLRVYVRTYPVEFSTVPPNTFVEFHHIYNVRTITLHIPTDSRLVMQVRRLL